MVIQQNWVFAQADEPRQLAISGLAADGSGASPTLSLGVHTSRNFAAISVQGDANSRLPLVFNPLGGGVAVGSTETFGNTFRVAGTARVNVLVIDGGSDVAEPVAVTATDAVARALPGMVMVIDRDHDGKIVPCSDAYDRAVAGVISGANGLKPGMVLSAEGRPHASGGDDTMPLAMTGRVWVLCDASHGAIRRGDSLTTSATPGHAMVMGDESKRAGSVIGKAMTELVEGRGLVLVLVNLQ